MFNDQSTPFAALATRRSGKPRDIAAPGPDAEQIDRILSVAMRTPDHGKLAPWRFVVIHDRDVFAALLERAYRAENPEPNPGELQAVEQFARQAPTAIVALSAPRSDSHIPLWEQQLSAGAACMNLLHAAHALGFAGGWLTGWAAYSEMVRDAFGSDGERIAGFLFLGTPGRELSERPRPDPARVVHHWP